MSKMNETELRRRLGLLSEIEPSAQATARALDRARQMLNEPTLLPSRRRTSFKMAGLAAVAAVILVALLLASLLTGRWDGTTAAYAKITEAVRNVPWMHMYYSEYSLNDAGNRTSAEGERDTEIWYSFNAQVVIYKYAHGAIDYYDYARQEIREYNPVAKRIVVSALPTGKRPFRLDSPGGWVEKSVEQITAGGGSVARERGQYKGCEVEIFEIKSAVRPGGGAVRSRIFVDRATSLPIAEEKAYVNTKTGKPVLVETGTFDYPDRGPADIYGLGLSRDIPTISSLPLPPWSDIRQTCQSYRLTPPAEKYVAVVTREMIGLVESVEIYYADGARFREEQHFLYRGGSLGPQWQRQKGELGNTLDSILTWSRAHRAYGAISISVTNGDRGYIARRDQDGAWSATQAIVPGGERAAEDFWQLSRVARLAWPEILGYADIIQDDHARENGLIRVDAEKGVFYLNPERDYICQQQMPLEGRSSAVLEFGRTDTGRWYPKRVDNSALKYTVYLETNPEFPEGIFDPNSLPKAGRQAAPVP
ncbi:MAG: hypothetical protein KBE65_01175 [Phycisphaerae bacterium]|nr:hypothetical protein [Phycisphaerae bacterium]